MPDFMNPAAAPGDPGFGGIFAATLTPDPGNTGDPDSDTQSATWVDADYTEDDVFSGLSAVLREYKAKLGPFDVDVTYNENGAAVLTASGLPLPLPAAFPLSAAALLTRGTVNGEDYDSVVPITVSDGSAATTDPETGTGEDAGDGTDAGDGDAPPQDLDITLGPPVTDIRSGSSVLYAFDDTDRSVYVRVSAVDKKTGEAIDCSQVLPRISITGSSPAEDDFLAGDWLTRTAATPAETYAYIDASGLERGKYDVYVTVTLNGKKFVRRCPGRLSVAL